MPSERSKKITTVAMLCAAAFAAMYFTRFLPPMVLFLKYDPKDVIITIGGFLFGPLYAVLISVIVSVLELSVSETGVIGLVMNVIASCAFAVPAAIIYKRHKNIKGALIGLVLGVVSMTVIMLLWNYILVPIYMDVPRSVVTGMLLPTFLPFNLLKASLNAGIILLLYKPLTRALRKINLLPTPPATTVTRSNLGILILSVFIIAASIVLIFVVQGKI